MIQVHDDAYFMKQAFLEAEKAKEEGEVPVGAVVVAGNRIIARGHNQTQLLHDVTAHAEIIALTAASTFLGSKYLHDCTMYITLEPCVMCAGALYWSQISRIVFSASDYKRGFLKHGKELLHPKTTLEYGIMEDQGKLLMQEFFKNKR